MPDRFSAIDVLPALARTHACIGIREVVARASEDHRSDVEERMRAKAVMAHKQAVIPDPIRDPECASSSAVWIADQVRNDRKETVVNDKKKAVIPDLIRDPECASSSAVWIADQVRNDRKETVVND